jgi:ketosteroid isomerase-like protein
MKRLRTRRLTTPVDPSAQGEREAQFARSMDAFIRRDFSVIDENLRPDVALEMPGSSWLAGTYQGRGSEPRRDGAAPADELGQQAGHVPP